MLLWGFQTSVCSEILFPLHRHDYPDTFLYSPESSYLIHDMCVLFPIILFFTTYFYSSGLFSIILSLTKTYICGYVWLYMHMYIPIYVYKNIGINSIYVGISYLYKTYTCITL